MCDEIIEESARTSLTRRGFTLAAAGTIAACTTAPSSATTALSEHQVTIKTPTGTADAFFVHPAQGKHPAVLMWPDIAGLRDAYKAMARRLAGDGFAVLVVNHYYRTAKAPLLHTLPEWFTPEGQAKIKPAIAAITPAGTVSDAKAYVAWLDQQHAVDTKRGIASSGYCMTGSFTVRTAAAVPGRVRAAASFHGGGLVGDSADAAHHLIASTKASFLFAIARNDDAKAPGDKDALKTAAAAAHRPAEIEVYPADHGWCTLDAPSYDKAQADRAWARMLVLFGGV